MKNLVKYQLTGAKRSVLIYYAILLFCVIVFSGSASLIIQGETIGNSSFNGIEIASVIFLFVCGLVSFSETFHMFLQNGITRKHMLLSLFQYGMILCIFMAFCDKIILLVGRLLEKLIPSLHFTPLFEMIFPSFAQKSSHVTVFLCDILYCFTIYAAFIFFGFFLAVASYRGSRLMRILIAAGLPVLIFVAFPIVDSLYEGRIYAFIIKMLLILSGANAQNPFLGMLFFLFITAFWGFMANLLGKRACKH